MDLDGQRIHSGAQGGAGQGDRGGGKCRVGDGFAGGDVFPVDFHSVQVINGAVIGHWPQFEAEARRVFIQGEC